MHIDIHVSAVVSFLKNWFEGFCSTNGQRCFCWQQRRDFQSKNFLPASKSTWV